MEHLYVSHLFHPRLRKYYRKVDGEVDCKSQSQWIITRRTLFSRYNRAGTHINSWQLWQNVQDLHKLKSDKIPASYYQLLVKGRVRVLFFNIFKIYSSHMQYKVGS